MRQTVGEFGVAMKARESYEYRNDFLFFVLRHGEDRGRGTWIYCSGVNLLRFLPLTKGRHGLGSNPAMRGLQLVNLGVRDLALSRGATPRTVRGKDCAGSAPAKDDWYVELLLIDNAPEAFPEEMLNYCATDLLRKIFKACLLDITLPDRLPEPDELQVFIEDQCSKFGR